MWTTIFYLVLALASLILALYLYGTRNYNYFKKLNFPHVTNNRPFLGSMWPFVMKKASLSELMKDLYFSQPEHSAIGMFEFGNPVVLLRDPELIKAVTVKDFDHFVDRDGAISEEVEPLFGKNLLSLEGQKWKDMRSTLSPAFTTSKIKAMFHFIADCGNQLADYLENKSKDETDGIVELETKDLFTRFANDVIATSAFGIHCDSLKEPENEFYMSGKDMTDFASFRTLVFFAISRISMKLAKVFSLSLLTAKTRHFFMSLISDTLQQREREGIIRPDMIHLMMEARKGSLGQDVTEDEHDEGHKTHKKHAMELSDLDITAQAVLFFLGGFDTTSTNLCFLTNLLAVHPDIQRRLQEEVDEILESDGGKITYEGIARMKYLDMCINESMRLWPPGSVTNRRCVKPYILPATKNTPSIEIKKGMGVWMPLFGIHRDAKYFENPDKFDPDRFSDENKNTIQPFTFMPFGTGPRNCIGMRFALVETKIAVVALISRFDLIVTAKTPTTLRLEKSGFNMKVEGGFWLGFKLRKNTEKQ